MRSGCGVVEPPSGSFPDMIATCYQRGQPKGASTIRRLFQNAERLFCFQVQRGGQEAARDKITCSFGHFECNRRATFVSRLSTTRRFPRLQKKVSVRAFFQSCTCVFFLCVARANDAQRPQTRQFKWPSLPARDGRSLFGIARCGPDETTSR